MNFQSYHKKKKLAIVFILWYYYDKMSYKLKFDGGCYPNPGGVATFGAVLYQDDVKLDWCGGTCGIPPNTSNNYAEHYAAHQGMEMFLRYITENPSHSKELLIQGDSEMTVKQLNGKYGLSTKTIYYPAALLSTKSLKVIKNKGFKVKIEHIYREYNQDCDDITKYFSKPS